MCTDQPPETAVPQRDRDSPVEKALETTVGFVKTHQTIQLQGSDSLFVKETSALICFLVEHFLLEGEHASLMTYVSNYPVRHTSHDLVNRHYRIFVVVFVFLNLFWVWLV